MRFGGLPPDEIERRHKASLVAFDARKRDEFAQWYREKCDEEYWSHGQCCFGCDHWQSDMGTLGHCAAVGVVPGDQVMASLGIQFCSYTPPPGLPFTKGDFYCGKFKDDFDWGTLARVYLIKIGAIRHGALRAKPKTQRAS